MAGCSLFYIISVSIDSFNYYIGLRSWNSRRRHVFSKEFNYILKTPCMHHQCDSGSNFLRVHVLLYDIIQSCVRNQIAAYYHIACRTNLDAWNFARITYNPSRKFLTTLPQYHTIMCTKFSGWVYSYLRDVMSSLKQSQC